MSVNINQTVAPVPRAISSECDRQILCCYTNNTNQIQNLQLTQIPNIQWQRVIFPRERLMFEAPKNSNLEIHLNDTVMAVIPCFQLQVGESKSGNDSSSWKMAS